jgi:hypothetical protein
MGLGTGIQTNHILILKKRGLYDVDAFGLQKREILVKTNSTAGAKFFIASEGKDTHNA